MNNERADVWPSRARQALTLARSEQNEASAKAYQAGLDTLPDENTTDDEGHDADAGETEYEGGTDYSSRG